ncbi:PREDICTED: heterogeneous nuclear ribonucleoprotein U-like protein 2 [Mandrillus leucophaeus]|uniref:heterogeneous nuclear ribonucleoprotein U-like protein 2 n=1 Tax=Mandrillus leucophaeus TaxID=9568 RepID=UPI0005F36D84|nr:PREDICTED: heterogeneous nuclear ribonucleoprotein U-like protein 2 [Mandrillus leucophaeus]
MGAGGVETFRKTQATPYSEIVTGVRPPGTLASAFLSDPPPDLEVEGSGNINWETEVNHHQGRLRCPHKRHSCKPTQRRDQFLALSRCPSLELSQASVYRREHVRNADTIGSETEVTSGRGNGIRELRAAAQNPPAASTERPARTRFRATRHLSRSQPCPSWTPLRLRGKSTGGDWPGETRGREEAGGTPSSSARACPRLGNRRPGGETAPRGVVLGSAAAMEAAAEPDASEKPVETTVGSGGVNGGEEQGPGKGEEDEPEERSGDETPGSEVPGDKAAEEQGDDQDSEKSKPAGSDGERRGVKRQRDEKDEHGRAYYEFREEAYHSRSKSPLPPEEEAKDEEEDQTLVNLDTYTSDLHFQVSKDRYGGQPLFSEKFPTLWSGARSTYGVTKGKVCFEAKVTQNLPMKEGCTEVSLLRVGWSVDFSRPQLGEDEFSYGFDGRGLKAENGQFEEFGQTFGENDVIGCFANFETEEVELSFSKNGEDLGVAFWINKESLADRALLPHVLCKNCVVELNFGQKEEPFFPPPEEFVFIHAVPVEERVRTAVPPKTIEECEVILMVGLPGSGKTQWALKYAKENPEKRYNVLGAETVLNQMRMKGLEEPEMDPKSRDLLVQQASQCLSKLVQIASRTKRNFILDQCNVYNSGQRRKLLLFKTFSRKVVVVVPNEEDWKKRLELRKEVEGDDVPESIMLEMKANFSLPEKCDYMDEVTYGELEKEEAQPIVTKYKEEARKLLPPSEKRTNRRNNRNKRNRQNRSRGQGYVGGQRRGYDNRAYGQQYWGQPGNRGGYRNFYDRYRGDYDRFYGRDYEYNRYRDYYRQYNRDWQSYYYHHPQDRDRYYRNYYGYQGYR